MFLTGSSGNQLIVDAVKDVFDIDYSWADWFQNALVPGVVGFILLPPFLQALLRPPPMDSAAVVELAKQELKQLGPMKKVEWLLVATFTLLLLLWATEKQTGLQAVKPE